MLSNVFMIMITLVFNCDDVSKLMIYLGFKSLNVGHSIIIDESLISVFNRLFESVLFRFYVFLFLF